MSRATDREILRAARTMASTGLVVGSVGNVSARVRRGVRITPTRRAYETLRRRDLVTVDLDGHVVRGRLTPSTELPLHLAVYRARPDVAAVVHTHSPYATAWSFRDAPPRPATEEIAYYGIGELRISAAAPAGSPDLARAGVGALADGRAALIGRHGVLAVGATVAEALAVAAAVEHQAQVATLLAAMG